MALQAENYDPALKAGAVINTANDIALTDGHIMVGNSSGLGTDVAMSGDVSITNAGATTVGKINGVSVGTATATSGNVLIGSGTAWVSQAVSGDITITSAGVTAIGAGKVTRAQMTAAGGRKSVYVTIPTVATTGNSDEYVIVPETGTLQSVFFSDLTGLAANDTNYCTFSITNLGTGGAGTAVMLAATAANTTKVTGGSAITANALRTLSLTAVSADLNVTEGDRLLVRIAVTGTLGGTLSNNNFLLRFAGTT